MRLSKNFTLKELEKSQAALRLGLNNSTPITVVPNLIALCANVLQPIRDHFGPVIVSSGYRSIPLNKAIGGSKSSQHCHGKAADFEVFGVDNLTVAKWIEEHIVFDQLILEFYEASNPNSGWIHCSYNGEVNREQALTAYKIGKEIKYVKGLPEQE
ncbi:MAG: D-Ala-D-Ala carboxypeptidase family metallohydrolase [Pelagibacteraceae bacterium]